MNHIAPKKHLGQHFLKDENIARKIVNSLSGKFSKILEIGPGEGMLTKYLIEEKNLDLRLIEIDRDSYEYLLDKFPCLQNKIIRDDFLKTRITDLFSEDFSIIGNFPYNISSQLLFRILEYRNNIKEVVCMLQKEVAERISSPPGDKEYGILSVMIQAYYDTELLFKVSEKVFYPRPKVQSAVIRMNRNSTEKLDCNEVLFFKIVKTAFNQRRKTLKNSLSVIVADKTSLSDNIFSKRPEQLSVKEFIGITNFIDSLD